MQKVSNNFKTEYATTCRIMYNVIIVLYIVFAVKITVNMIHINIIWYYHSLVYINCELT